MNRRTTTGLTLVVALFGAATTAASNGVADVHTMERGLGPAVHATASPGPDDEADERTGRGRPDRQPDHDHDHGRDHDPGGQAGGEDGHAHPPHGHGSHDFGGETHDLQSPEVAGGSVGVLEAGGDLATFWQTPEVECTTHEDPSNLSGPASCEGTTFSYTVTLGTPAERLRVDMDYPYRQDDHVLTVVTPLGDEISQSSANTYSHGVIVEDAVTGVYGITLDVQRTDLSRVRLRAGIVPPLPPEATVEGLLLPNLRVTPPFELGFAAPVNPANSTFMAGDDQNPGVLVDGDPLYSCTADEVQEAADPTRYDPDELTALTKCLRFTAGPHNVGDGHLDLRFPIVTRATGGEVESLQEMTQFIRTVDGGSVTRPAGSYEYHPTHGHYHYLDILYYELLAVDEIAGAALNVGVGHKSGFCPADQGYGSWGDFDQLPKGTVGGEQGASCFAFSGDGALGLTAGWGDFYRWQRPGQFVDFSGRPDGLYVVRATVDVLDNVLERDETDNSSYAYVRVTGDEIELIERGYGRSPFDPEKVVATDNRGQAPTAGLLSAVERANGG